MNATTATRPLVIVTSASTGVGYELARECARHGYDLLLAADEMAIHQATKDMEADLAQMEGVDIFLEAFGEGSVELLLANADRGLGKGFLDQDFDAARNGTDTNITGTIYLIHKVGQGMRARGKERILITGSIAGYLPGSFQAVYKGTKAFRNPFSFALRNELKESGVTVTWLRPGAMDTEFFQRADMTDTKVGMPPKDDPAEVAKNGFEATMRCEGDVVSGWKTSFRRWRPMCSREKCWPSSTGRWRRRGPPNHQIGAETRAIRRRRS